MTTKVSKEAALAFWRGRPYAKGNTAVIVDGNKVTMTLFGNVIAEVVDGLSARITNAGWPTATTRDRLTGILAHVGVQGADLPRQQNHQQYLYDDIWDGSWHVVHVPT